MILRFALSAIVLLTLVVPSVVAQQWYVFGGVYECTGRAIGANAVKLNCQQEQTRGNRIYALTPSFTINGPVAKKYLGKHTDCRPLEPSETRFNQAFVECPGIAKWW